MPQDLADNNAAIAKAYVRIQQDRGATCVPRYCTVYEKSIDGDLQ